MIRPLRRASLRAPARLLAPGLARAGLPGAAGLLLALGIALAGVPGASAEPAPATGGVRLLASMESAPITAVGVLREAVRIDARAFRAQLRVEALLRAPEKLAATVASGTPILLVWEERAPTRPTRFVDGDRILVILEALPSDSIWLARIPEPAERLRTLHVAQHGDAFLRRPALRTVDILEHYLALSPPARRDVPGVVHLANLARGAAEPLALDSIAALRGVPTLDEKLDPTTSGWLVDALLRPDASPGLQQAILQLIGVRRLESLQPVLEERVRLAAGRLRPDGSSDLADPLVYAALIELGVEIEPATLAQLTEQPTAAHRLAAVGAQTDASTLRDLARHDEDPTVRAAAVERLVTLDPLSAMPSAIDALYDRDPLVRRTATFALIRVGPAAVADLRRVVEDESQPAGIAAIQALRGIRPEGVQALREIAATSPNESMRAAARLALGLEIAEEH